MSIVYRATDTQLNDRPVVVKILSPQLAHIPQYRERFFREVRAVATLRHPHIVDVYEAATERTAEQAAAGRYQGSGEQEPLYLVMPYIEGSSLRGLLADNRQLDLATAVRLCEQIASALDFAHRRGIVHRDVKPGNILVESETGHAYLCDFGIAKVGFERALTAVGGFLGTPDYSAPERFDPARFEELPMALRPTIERPPREVAEEKLVDIYALGVVMYECLTGSRPFGQLGEQVRRDPPALTELRPDLPPALDDVLRAAMARDPTRRPSSCAEFASRLAAAAASLRSAPSPVGPASPPSTTTRFTWTPPSTPPDLPFGAPPLPPGGAWGPPPGSPPPADALTASPAGATGQTPTGQVAPGPGRRRLVAARRVAARHRRPLIAAGASLIAVGVLLGATLPAALDKPGVGDRPDQRQLVRIPEPLRADCARDKPAGGADVVVCHDVDQPVQFSFFASLDEMDSAYGAATRDAGVSRGTGDCSVAVGTGAEHRYPGVDASPGGRHGRLLCHTRDGTTSLVWTDDKAMVLATASSRAGDDLALRESWSRWVGLKAFPTTEEKALVNLYDLKDCRRPAAGTLERFHGIVAAIECAPPNADEGATTVWYYQFTALDGLRSTYDAQVSAVQAPKDTYCGDGGENPGTLGTNQWDLRGVDLGNLLCYRGSGGVPTMEWTLESMRVLGRVVGHDPADLATWWAGNHGPSQVEITKAVNRTSTPPFPTAAERQLLTHIPPAARVDCMRLSEDQVKQNVGDQKPVAAIACDSQAGNPRIIFYYQMADAAALAATLRFNDPGTDADCTQQPPDFLGGAPYLNNGDTGRLVCGTNQSGARYLIWSNDRLNILACAFGSRLPPADLIAWWSANAGPR
ncbi:serine/threonine-protein kinase [Pseudofrankia sp. BMG5.36]|uniref:serine/threonine-protein kinase n=1 Tax=Pseudofrankia sp. BMG5.36 TaxID=1834512 RepID=UPI001041E906|nr:serine/threonine-protein kinase [Pseudofrankia sp. BMG5.36]